MNKPITYRVLGLMSGTSLDGLDIAYCVFTRKKREWTFAIKKAVTVKYSRSMKEKLAGAATLSGIELMKLHRYYGLYIAREIKKFLLSNTIKPELISSHGHTVFHQPEYGITWQIGSPYAIASVTGITTIADFRSADVAFGGQGAPLVPVGDHYLFSAYDACLNLGGFSNISFCVQKKRIAFDICPVNSILNHIARQQGLAFDNNGQLAKKGKVHSVLLQKLNNLPYYKQAYPKSLSREWLEREVLPLICNYTIMPQDLLRTLVEHIAVQISYILNRYALEKVLVTGGGVHNGFLMQVIREKTTATVVVPEKKLVDFKEAMIFAFLGVLRIRGENNCWGSVTGAKRDHCSGMLVSGDGVLPGQ